MTTTMARLSTRALVRLAGPDWRSFLQGLVTRDLNDPAASPLAYAALLAPQGRLLHDFFIWTLDEESALLDVDAAWAEPLAAALSRYRLRAKVRVEPAAGGVQVAFGPSPPSGEGWRADPRLPALGWRRLDSAEGAGPAKSDPTADGDGAWNAHRLALGVPEPVHDARPNDYPLELDLDLLHGVDFRKGCFVGQETTSRMRRRAGVRSRMVPVTFEGSPPAFGTELVRGGLRVGEIRSGAHGRALALTRLDRLAGQLEAEGRVVALAPPPWLEPHLQTDASAASADA